MGMFPPLMITDVDQHGEIVHRELRHMMSSEFIAMERVTGIKGTQAFMDALGNVDMGAIVALVWVARKRKDPELRHADVDVDLDAFNLDFYAKCGRHIAVHTRTEAGKIVEAPCAECAAEAGEPVAADEPDPSAAVTETAHGSDPEQASQSAASDVDAAQLRATRIGSTTTPGS